MGHLKKKKKKKIQSNTPKILKWYIYVKMDKWKIILEIFWFLERIYYTLYHNFKVKIYSHTSRGSTTSSHIKTKTPI